MSDQMSLFNMVGIGADHMRAIKSTDWKWSFSDYPKEKNGLKVFSCFACGGGSTMGYKLAGCEVIGCCEIDKAMNDVYVMNHHPKHNFLMDIRDFNALPNSELPQDLFHLDILDGSPPCTTFSMAGDREETWGKKKKFREGQKEQTLDDLSFIFIDTVKKLKPRTVIMENVEGLLLREAFSYVREIYRRFADAGYRVKHWLLKGEEMGVPQTRHRTFFIALREDMTFDLEKLDMTFNYEPIPFRDIKQGEGRPLTPGTITQRIVSQAQPGEPSMEEIFARLREKERCFNQKLWWDDRVVTTVTAKANYFRGVEKTHITAEDVINAQTFPQDYLFPMRSLSAVGYICGMSVPPLMIKRIVTRMIEAGVFMEGSVNG